MEGDVKSERRPKPEIRGLLETIVIVILLAGLVAVGVWGDYSLWRLQHPQAPAWTYIFSD